MKNLYKLKAMRSIAGIIALVAVIGFSMSACKDTPDDGLTLPAAIKGTWKNATNDTFVLSDTQFKRDDNDGAKLYCTVTAYTAATNGNSAAVTAGYGSGYHLTVTTTTNEGGYSSTTSIYIYPHSGGTTALQGIAPNIPATPFFTKQ